MFLRIVRIIFRFVLRIIARIEITGLEHIPDAGAAIVVMNHLGRLDAILGVILADRDDFILMIADKYQKSPFWRWWGGNLDAIWLNRNEADFHALRLVLKRLQKDEILGMAPEGTRSESEMLQPGKLGAAFLAARAQVPLIPVGITGTEDRVVKYRLKRLRRLDIDIRIDEAFMLPPFPRRDRDIYLEQGTEEIMCRIGALLPAEYRGVYLNHPRLQQLVAEQLPLVTDFDSGVSK